MEGKGRTPEEAVSTSVLSGHVAVRSPTLNGINLGYAATHPGAVSGTSGGSTRFSSLEAMVVASATTTQFRDIRAHAGALAAFGEVNMAPSHGLTGHLHVDLGATRVLAPIRVAVRGTVVRPEFGR